MQKRVLEETIRNLGINEGDVVRIFKINGSVDYIYENNHFYYINFKDDEREAQTLGDDEVMDLIMGAPFEVIAYGTSRADLCQGQINEIHKAIVIDQKAKQEIQEKICNIASNIIFFGSIGILLIWLLTLIF